MPSSSPGTSCRLGSHELYTCERSPRCDEQPAPFEAVAGGRIIEVDPALPGGSMIRWHCSPSRHAVLTAGWLLLAGGRLPAQEANRGAFVVTLGRDTLGVEQYTRSGNTITGDIITRSGGTMVYHYVLALSPQGAPLKIEATPRTAAGGVVARGFKSVTVTYSPDSMTSVMYMPTVDTAVTRRLAVRGALPMIATSMAL